MRHIGNIQDLAKGLKVAAITIKQEPRIEKPDLRRILKFLASVVFAIDTVFDSVITVLESVKNLKSGDDLEKVRQIIAASKNNVSSSRNVRKLYCRLDELAALYDVYVEPIVRDQNLDSEAWLKEFGRLSGMDGLFIANIDRIFKNVANQLTQYLNNEMTLDQVKDFAEAELEELAISLDQIHQVKRSLLKKSGKEGFFALTEIDEETGSLVMRVEFKSNPWISGSFYLLSTMAVLGTVATVAHLMPLSYLPLVIIGSAMLFAVIGAHQLKNDGLITEASFLQLMKMSFYFLPFFLRKKKGSN